MSPARSQRWTATLWIGALASFALAAWLFLPRASASRPAAPRLRVVLVDASASCARARNWLSWVRSELRAQAEQAASAREDLAVAAFAGGLATGFAPGEPARFLDRLEGRGGVPFDPAAGLEPGATRLAAALEGVETWLLDPERPPGELVLLGPSTFTGRSPAAVLARISLDGVSVIVRAPPPAEESDLGLVELAVAPRVEAGAPLVALARLVLHRGTAPLGTARLELRVECDGAVRERALDLALPGADGEFELPLDCGPASAGENAIHARVSWSSGPDLLPENDVAEARAYASGSRVIGVAVSAESRAAAEEWLAPGGRSWLAGLQFTFLEARELGPRLAELDAVVSFDLAVRELAPLLEPFVRGGGGWLALAGWRFLADWLPGAGGTLAELLPSEPAQGELPPRDVVLLVDGSGSMEGAPFETVRAAAIELVRAALPSDRVSLRFFTERLEPAHLLKERSEDAQEEDTAVDAVRELLGLRVPSGTTHLLPSLRELRSTAGERQTLLLLLSDGRDRAPGSDERAAREVAADLAAARVRLVVIGVGDRNQELLAALAGGPGEVRSGDALADLEAIFRRELQAPRLLEGELELRLGARPPGSLADEVASSASAQGVPAPLERSVRNRLRPDGEALWVTVEGEPVLTLARAGLGRTAFFASRPGADWARRHAQGVEPGLAGVLRWLARGPEHGTRPRARLEDGRLRVTGLAPGTPAELRGSLFRSDGTPVLAELALAPPPGPGLDVQGTREVSVVEEGWDEPGGLVLSFRDGSGVERSVPVERALADELAWRERAVPVEGLPDGPAAPPGRGVASLPLAMWATALGLALLFAAGVASARGQGVPASSR